MPVKPNASKESKNRKYQKDLKSAEKAVKELESQEIVFSEVDCVQLNMLDMTIRMACLVSWSASFALWTACQFGNAKRHLRANPLSFTASTLWIPNCGLAGQFRPLFGVSSDFNSKNVAIKKSLSSRTLLNQKFWFILIPKVQSSVDGSRSETETAFCANPLLCQ